MRSMDMWTHRDHPMKIEWMRIKDDDSRNDI